MKLAIMLICWPDREWVLLPWSICFPSLTVAISWALVRWRKKLVVLALAIAAVSASLIIHQLKADLDFRKESKTQLDAMLDVLLREKSENPDSLPESGRENRLERLRDELRFFDSQMHLGIPPLDRNMILAVWFAALFPFFMIAVFYFTTSKPNKELPTPRP